MAARMAGHTGNNTKRQGVCHAIDQESRRGVHLNVLDGPSGGAEAAIPRLVNAFRGCRVCGQLIGWTCGPDDQRAAAIGADAVQYVFRT